MSLDLLHSLPTLVGTPKVSGGWRMVKQYGIVIDLVLIHIEEINLKSSFFTTLSSTAFCKLVSTHDLLCHK